jgi:hypothetical protein
LLNGDALLEGRVLFDLLARPAREVVPVEFRDLWAEQR